MNLCIQFIIPFNNPPIAALAEARTKLEDCKGGFPHSEITGSKGASASPVLIAACHVLHRLSTPRHPSEALQRLIVSQQNSCVVYSARLERCRGTTPDFCQTMSSSRTEAFKLRGAGYVLPSRFQCLSPSGDGQFLMRSASFGGVRHRIQSGASGLFPGRGRGLVEPDGVEPTTSCLQSRRSTN